MTFDISSFEIFNSIKFYGKDHTYKINGETCPLSVTRFLNMFSPDFDQNKVAARVAAKQGVDTQTIIREWELEKDAACLKGTIFHNYIDNYLNKKILPLNNNEIDHLFKNNQKEADAFRYKVAKLIMQFKDFYEYYNERFIHFKSEYVVGDIHDTKICGTIDNLSLCRKTGQLFVLDYKTNKKFTISNSYGSRLKYPVNHLDDSKISVYGLQLSLYSYIVHKYTSVMPKRLIIWFNENNDTYKLYEELDYISDIENMIKYYKETNDSRTISTLTTATEDYILSLEEA